MDVESLISQPAARVGLLGRRCGENGNLGLDYLLAALRDAAVPAELYVLDDWREMEAICRTILDARVELLGLALPDGGSAFLPLGLGEMLHARGFRGHITSGGAFATAARTWLLERYGWLDSVVRFSGERPLVELARRLASDRDVAWRQTPGISSRDGDGPPADLLDDTPLRTLPARDTLPTILEVPMAHLTATRGCLGQCTYCSPAALLAAERREAQRAGASARELRRAGVGGVRRRDLEQLCDEMAALWHERGVRYFYFVDEHLLPYDEDAALDFLARWREGLERRGLERWGLGTMLRAELLTPRIADALVDAGLVRTLLGIEFGSAAEGARFLRRTDISHARALLERFAHRGVATFSNVMIVHPYSTLESIAEALEMLESLPAGVFDATRMMVFEGTLLKQQIEREGRLVGNPLHYGYTIPDRRVAAFADIFTRLRAEAFGRYSVSFAAHDADLMLALARRLHPRTDLDRVATDLAAALRAVNRFYIDASRRALSLARSGASANPAPLLDEVRRRADVLQQRLAGLARTVSKTVGGREKIFSPMRAAAATLLNFVVGATLAACSSRPLPADASLDAAGDLLRPDVRAGCTITEITQQRERVINTVKKTDACFAGTIRYGSTQGQRTIRREDEYQGLGPCQTTETQKLVGARIDRIGAALAGVNDHCLYPGSLVSVPGDVTGEQQRMADALTRDCPSWPDYRGLMVVLDSSGKVLEVKSQPGTTIKPEAVLCVQKALSGLSFPCLAGYQVCPEFLTVE